MIALLYAFVIGVVSAGVAPAGVHAVRLDVARADRLSHRIVTWQEYPAYHRVLLKTFVYGTFVMGAYGVIQFVSPPPWDGVLDDLLGHGQSEGTPVPFGMRISSTMNSCGPFAITIMMRPADVARRARQDARSPAAVVGVPALLFTSVRTAWGGWSSA